MIIMSKQWWKELHEDYNYKDEEKDEDLEDD